MMGMRKINKRINLVFWTSQFSPKEYPLYFWINEIIKSLIHNKPSDIHFHMCWSCLFCVSAKDHDARGQFFFLTYHCCFFVCSGFLALFGQSDLAPDWSGSFFLAQQTPGATLEPLFLAEILFLVCQNSENLVQIRHWPRTGVLVGKGHNWGLVVGNARGDTWLVHNGGLLMKWLLMLQY